MYNNTITFHFEHFVCKMLLRQDHAVCVNLRVCVDGANVQPRTLKQIGVFGFGGGDGGETIQSAVTRREREREWGLGG